MAQGWPHVCMCRLVRVYMRMRTSMAAASVACACVQRVPFTQWLGRGDCCNRCALILGVLDLIVGSVIAVRELFEQCNPLRQEAGLFVCSFEGDAPVLKLYATLWIEAGLFSFVTPVCPDVVEIVRLSIPRQGCAMAECACPKYVENIVPVAVALEVCQAHRLS